MPNRSGVWHFMNSNLIMTDDARYYCQMLVLIPLDLSFFRLELYKQVPNLEDF